MKKGSILAVLGLSGFVVMADNWVVSPILPSIAKGFPGTRAAFTRSHALEQVREPAAFTRSHALEQVREFAEKRQEQPGRRGSSQEHP